MECSLGIKLLTFLILRESGVKARPTLFCGEQSASIWREGNTHLKEQFPPLKCRKAKECLYFVAFSREIQTLPWALAGKAPL